MSAETLRKAAALMRERAEDARSAVGDAPWNWDNGWCEGLGTTYTVSGEHVVAEAVFEEVAEYLCPMRPAVALAVADLLEVIAETWGKPGHRSWHASSAHALEIARAYLGNSA